MPEFNGWYTTEGGGTFKNNSVGTSNINGLELCKRCSEPLGCRYPRDNDYKYSGDYFKSTKANEFSHSDVIDIYDDYNENYEIKYK